MILYKITKGIIKLYNIINKYSKYDIDTIVAILDDEWISLDEKFNKLF